MENSSFVLVFGNSPFVRVLDFFLNYDSFDYSIAHIAKETGTKWESVVDAVGVLLKKKVVVNTRKVGKAQLYMFDKESPLSGLLEEIDMKISDFFVKKELGRQKVLIK